MSVDWAHCKRQTITNLLLSSRRVPPPRYRALSADAKDLLLKMLADDPKARPTCLEVLKHPFMTADESNTAAHREIGDVVRRRMSDLAQLRWVGSSACIAERFPHPLTAAFAAPTNSPADSLCQRPHWRHLAL